MNRPATYEDAQLVLRLFELRREPRMREAREWFAGSFTAETAEELERLCPKGSRENAYFRMLVGYWDMAASFITSGVLHRELFFESGWELLLCWEKVRRLLPALRQASSNRTLFRNLEEVGTAYVEWLEARAPDFYDAYCRAVGAMAEAEAAADGRRAEA